MTFAELGLDESILKALEKMQYVEPSAIQALAIPKVLEGRDLIALAQTGSGKTAACAIPICQKVNVNCLQVQALIIVPTRELALQYASEVQKIGGAKGVKAFALYGGQEMGLQESKLKAGVQVLVATPGRLIDFIYNRLIDLSKVDTLILDEADEMLSMGFYEDLEFIINCLVHEHQTLLFSATMPPQIKKIAHQHMKNPEEIVLTKTHASPKSLEHRFVFCSPHDRDKKLIDLLVELKPPQALIFCKSRIECESLCRVLQRRLDRVDFLHAGLSQDIRNIITSKFRSGKIACLVATDVAARGLDFSQITHVFMHHLPSDPEVYVHRSGRTGRQDREGTSIAFITQRELGVLPKILKLIQREATWIGDPPPAQSAQPRRRDYPRRPPGGQTQGSSRRGPSKPA